MSDYGMLASVIEVGKVPYFCIPNLPMEEYNSEIAVFFCQQGQRVSAIEMFRILAWILGNAVVGGYILNVDEACDFLMANGVSMIPGEVSVDFKIIMVEDCYMLESQDDRAIQIGNFRRLEDMSEALYHLLDKMNDCFGGGLVVSFTFQGEDAEEFSDLLEDRHRTVFFDLNTDF
ncbi:MAG: hypothetical protein IKD75_04860 [Prevotella sp.]|nr:hypothetical protein [Prevotella sp.]